MKHFLFGPVATTAIAAACHSPPDIRGSGALLDFEDVPRGPADGRLSGTLNLSTPAFAPADLGAGATTGSESMTCEAPDMGKGAGATTIKTTDDARGTDKSGVTMEVTGGSADSTTASTSALA